MKSRWRSIARPIIADVIADIGLEDEKKLKKALREAYPFGERAYHPYKIWLDEVKIQTGKKQKKPIKKDKRQMELFK